MEQKNPKEFNLRVSLSGEGGKEGEDDQDLCCSLLSDVERTL